MKSPVTQSPIYPRRQIFTKPNLRPVNGYQRYMAHRRKIHAQRNRSNVSEDATANQGVTAVDSAKAGPAIWLLLGKSIKAHAQGPEGKALCGRVLDNFTVVAEPTTKCAKCAKRIEAANGN